MDMKQAMNMRHSVRQYINRPLEENTIQTLRDEIERCNQESGLNIQLVTNEPKAFNSFMAHYGKFSGVTNYIALIGKKEAKLDEKCGYYGERLVLLAQQLGLNSCWVAMTYKKIPSVFKMNKGEKIVIVIAIGYGMTQGIEHKSKGISDVAVVDGEMPEWFRRGIEAALLAPTAMNQQKFKFILEGNNVLAHAGRGFYSKIDLGIVKFHFEIGARKENFKWKND